MTAVSLHYTVEGPSDGPTLVLGSSLGTTSALWEPQLAALTNKLRVVRYDHRGHGRSPVPPGPYRLDELASDVLTIVDSLGVDRFRIAGISLGGMVAMWIGSHVPDRVKRMVLVCTSAKLGPPEMWQERAKTVRAEGMGSIAGTLLGRWVPAEFATRRPDIVENLRAMLVSTPVEGYAGCCAAIETMDLEHDLATVIAPTLVIAGAEDESTPPEHAQRIAAGIAGSQLTLVAGAAHLANVSHPELIGQLMSDFLTEDAQ
jgi:3-oxoadipate enol-lactonase